MKLVRNILKFFVSLLLAGVLVIGSVAAAAILSPSVSSFISGFYAIETVEAADEITGVEAAETGSPAIDISFDETFYPYYAMLDEEAKTAYTLIYQGYLDYAETIELEAYGFSEDQFSAAWAAVYKDHPELFWAMGQCSYSKSEDGTVLSASPEYYLFSEGLDAAKSSFEASAQSIIAEAAQLSSDYEKEVFVHDALAELVSYDAGNEYNQSAYSALVDCSSVCAGYTRAFQYILMECGIPCYYCAGYCEGDHAWNIVMLDGEYYNVDLTWDDSSSSYAFFNRTDSDFALTHERRSASVYLPACSGETYRNTSPMPYETVPDFSGGARGGITAEPPDMPASGQGQSSGSGQSSAPGSVSGTVPGQNGGTPGFAPSGGTPPSQGGFRPGH